MRAAPEASVTNCVATQLAANLFITTITQAEIFHGVLLLSPSRSGRPISQFDAQIAAIVKSTGAGLCTGNHFEVQSMWLWLSLLFLCVVAARSANSEPFLTPTPCNGLNPGRLLAACWHWQTAYVQPTMRQRNDANQRAILCNDLYATPDSTTSSGCILDARIRRQISNASAILANFVNHGAG